VRHVFDRNNPTDPIGLRFRVDGTARPGLTVSASASRRVRVAIQHVPVLWARTSEDNCYYELLRAPGLGSPGILPPLRAALVREHAEVAHPALAWAETYVALLHESPASPLYDRQWCLGSSRYWPTRFKLPAPVVHQVVEQRANGEVHWDIAEILYPITLRDMSAPDDGRVKLWRKHARADTLPPVLLFWVSGLDCYLVLDGHDRLLAASLEDAAAPALALEPLDETEPSEDQQRQVTAALTTALEVASRATVAAREAGLARPHRPITTDDSNRILLDAFHPRQHVGRSRAFRMPGGDAQWAREVQAALKRRGIRDSWLLSDA